MPDQVLQDIKDRLNIAEVIGGYIPIKKAGVNFKAMCPFHGEKTASLIISPQKQIWHCFGCGEGGDVFGFITRYENLDFKDALKILAEKAGVKLPEYRPKDPKLSEYRERLLRVNDFAARLYHQVLTKDKAGAGPLAYLKQRGLTEASIKQWQIGFAPQSMDFLQTQLVKKGASLQELVDAGVVAKNESGKTYDRFYSRITFPIFNYLGEIVGFSARTFPEGSHPAKYINSPETAIYSKSKVLFGLNFAKAEIRKLDAAVVVEGQMDCISAHQAGFTNVVASSGTALTSEQLNLLGRLTRTIILCFDADAAGATAARRAVEAYLGQGFQIKILVLQGAKDPDELIRKNPKSFASQLSAAPYFLDYYFTKALSNFRNSSLDQKKQAAKDLLPLIKNLTDPLEQDHYLRLLAERFGTNAKVLWEALGKLANQIGAQAKRPASTTVPNGRELLEKEVLGGMLKFPDFSRKVLAESQTAEFKTPAIRQIIEPLQSSIQGPIDAAAAVAKEALFMVELQLEEAEGNERAVLKNLEKSFSLFKLQNLKAQALDLNLQIKLAEQQNNKADLAKLQQEFARLGVLRIRYETQV